MSEPRRSTRARAREEAAPAVPDTPNEKPARGAKATLKRKRASIAVRESAPSTPVGEGAPLTPRQLLPHRITEGAPLPTLSEPQPLDLPSSEWQTIQQSGVLDLSFERSKAVWLSGANFRTFHKHFNQPKKLADRTDEDKAKAQRQKELLKNFPQAAPPPQAPAAPAPDPVIHMLAARAGTDPELKAVMKIVAAGSASKEQLEFFQTHINELTNILARQKEEKMAKLPQPPPPTPKAPPPPPPPKQISHPPPPRPVQPLPQQIQPNTPKPYSPVPIQSQMQHAPPVQQPHTPYGNSYNKPPQYHPQHPAPAYTPPPRTTYRPLVFSFVHGNEDKFYFPSYSFMEWLPNGTGAKLSFLITKMKPKPEPEVKPPSTPAPKPEAAPVPAPAPTPAPSNAPQATPGAPTPDVMTPTHNPTLTPIQPATSAPPTPFVPPKPPQRIEDFDEMNEIDNIEFYQPVTVLLLIENDEGDEIASALPRSVRPPQVVEKYMNAVFDRCKRADETYLAFRLPRDGDEPVEKKAKSGEATPAATPTVDFNMGGFGAGMAAVLEKKKAGRPRKSLV
ncbi:hypothetical protein PTT_16373 [Pyrenophora teres f. teres 0-1]|uniref:PAT1 multi-domain protein n=1 Tax=Pyrenophora teres f. teres (strain 0-1) TaxID=861557 RepID=E3S264_PYRTT|nr:hypothetical protein PTT_16373 [Pyrenophora teres f. teres 0-1]